MVIYLGREGKAVTMSVVARRMPPVAAQQFRMLQYRAECKFGLTAVKVEPIQNAGKAGEQPVFDRGWTAQQRRPVRALLLVYAVTLGCLLAGCAGTGGTQSQSASIQASPPVEDPNSPDAEVARVEARERALSPDYIRRRRQAIAELLEKNAGLGAAFHDKFRDARLAGPKVEKSREWTSFVSSHILVRAIYCAKVKLDPAPDIFAERTALIVVDSSSNGMEQLHSRVERGSFGVMDKQPLACYHIGNYEPFPELEQQRARHWQQLQTQ